MHGPAEGALYRIPSVLSLKCLGAKTICKSILKPPEEIVPVPALARINAIAPSRSKSPGIPTLHEAEQYQTKPPALCYTQPSAGHRLAQ